MNLVALEFKYKIQIRFGFVINVLPENTTEVWNSVAMKTVFGNYVSERVDKTITLWFRILEVFDSNIGRDPDCFGLLCYFPQPPLRQIQGKYLTQVTADFYQILSIPLSTVILPLDAI
jgi:hypothetical protein